MPPGWAREINVSTSAAHAARHTHFGWFKRRRDLEVDDVTVVDRSLLNRAVGAAALGNAMEWFDFGVYGYIAVTLGHVFFPSSDPALQLIATFATFTVAFLVRPLGRTGVRAAGRSLWPAQDIGDDHDPDGGRHLFHRPHPLLCADRHRRTADAAGRAAGAGFFDRRRIWRRGNLHRGIFDRPEARPDGQLAGVRDAGRLYRRRRQPSPPCRCR